MQIKRVLPVLLGAALLLTGCSKENAGTDSAQSGETVQEEAVVAEVIVPMHLYYATDHGTEDPANLSDFFGQMEDAGTTVDKGPLLEFPLDADTVIIDSPTEDITLEELQRIDEFFDGGGQVVLLMPAQDTSVRFKYIERMLDELCIVLDYDRIESDKMREDGYLPGEVIGPANGMTAIDNAADRTPAYFRNARSFHFTYGERYGSVRQDSLIETQGAMRGVPCGGVEDDPETYEEPLMEMVYARDDERLNCAVLAVGSSDFLLNENTGAETCVAMRDWVYTTLYWFMRL